MNRRELLMRSLIGALGLSGAQILVSCGQDNSGPGNNNGLTTTSSSSGHTHQFTITADELASPVDISRNDSVNGHSHLVELTANQVTSIANGSAVQITSGVTNGHSHTYTFQKS